MVYKTALPGLLMGCSMMTKLYRTLQAVVLGWSVLRLESASPVVEAPLSPVEAARSMVVPEAFNVTLFAGEPDVMQPVGFCIDDRGRIWVAEAYNYPDHGTRPRDRIVILEDTDHDGRRARSARPARLGPRRASSALARRAPGSQPGRGCCVEGTYCAAGNIYQPACDSTE